MNWIDFLSSYDLTVVAETAGGTYRRNMLGADIFQAIRNTDYVGLFCLSVLGIFSVISWAVIAYKFLHIRQAMKQSRRFLDLCANSGRLDDAFRHAGSFPDSPLALIARETFLEVQTENWYQAAAAEGVSHRLEVAKLSLERVHDRTITREISHLESWTIFLAITASVSPYIGLFGTVWGVLGVFQSLGNQSSANLQVIAPGIATALTSTVAGLSAAIPATVFYNYLTSSIQVMISRMDAFAMDLKNVVQKEILGG